MNTLFSTGSLLVMPFWFLMILLPRWNWTRRIVRSPWIVLGPIGIYAILILPRLAPVLSAVQQPTLPGIQALLGTPAGATLAWAHFLAFDLFIGRWISLDSRERGLSPWLVSPLLLLTLMLGPLGLLSYLGLRAASPSLEMLTGVIGRAFKANPPLTVASIALTAFLVFCLGGLLFDAKMVLGVPAFLKPAKFAVSTAIYTITLLWVLSFVRERRRFVLAISWVIADAIVIEDSLIAMQALRGTTSHFNVGTPFDFAVYETMGVTILILWLANIGAAILLMRQRFPGRAFGLSLKLGLVLSIVGNDRRLPDDSADGGADGRICPWTSTIGGSAHGRRAGRRAGTSGRQLERASRRSARSALRRTSRDASPAAYRLASGVRAVAPLGRASKTRFGLDSGDRLSWTDWTAHLASVARRTAPCPRRADRGRLRNVLRNTLPDGDRDRLARVSATDTGCKRGTSLAMNRDRLIPE